MIRHIRLSGRRSAGFSMVEALVTSVIAGVVFSATALASFPPTRARLASTRIPGDADTETVEQTRLWRPRDRMLLLVPRRGAGR